MRLTAVLIAMGLLFASLSARAERWLNPPGDATVHTVDTSSTNLPATYGAAGNSYATSVSGAANICVLNAATTKLYATTSTVSNCTGATDKWVVPANTSGGTGGSACFLNTKINSNICVRSSSGTVSSGVIDLVVW